MVTPKDPYILDIVEFAAGRARVDRLIRTAGTGNEVVVVNGHGARDSGCKQLAPS